MITCDPTIQFLSVNGSSLINGMESDFGLLRSAQHCQSEHQWKVTKILSATVA